MVDKLKSEVRVPVYVLTLVVTILLALAGGLVSMGVSVAQIRVNAEDIRDLKHDTEALKDVLVNTVSASVNQVQNNTEAIRKIEDIINNKIDEKRYQLDMQQINARLAAREARLKGKE